MSRVSLMSFAVVGFSILIAACGGAEEPSVGGEGSSTSVMSSDGVVTVAVPAGVAPPGADVTVVAGDRSTLPSELVDSGLPTFIYDLGPDGTEFSDSVRVTFRIPAEDAGFDHAEGMPLAVLASRSGDEPFELYESIDVSLDGDDLVVSGSTDHFSDAVVIVSDAPLSLATTPSPAKVGVGQTFQAELVNIKDGLRASLLANDRKHLSYKSTQPVTYLGKSEELVGEFRCDAETDGVLPRAVSAEIRRDTSGLDEETKESFEEGNLFQFVALAGDIFGVFGGSEVVASFHADVECTAADASPPPTETTSSTEAPKEPGEDPVGDQENDNSQTVGEGEGEPGADIVRVRYATGDAGEQCFFVEVAGDGEAAATASEWYDIIIKATDAEGDEWSANVAYFGSEATDRGVRLGPPAPGQSKLEGATVTAEWIDGVLKVTVVGGEAELAVDTFQVAIGVSNPDAGRFWDTATGVAE